MGHMGTGRALTGAHMGQMGSGWALTGANMGNIGIRWALPDAHMGQMGSGWAITGTLMEDMLLLLLLKKIGNARLGEGDCHPISPKTPAPHYQPIEEKKRKGK